MAAGGPEVLRDNFRSACHYRRFCASQSLECRFQRTPLPQVPDQPIAPCLAGEALSDAVK